MSPFPTFPETDPKPCADDKVCYTPADDYAITLYLMQVNRWRAEVRSCKSIKERRVVFANSYSHTMYSIMESFPN